jgi:hypothetical protein
MNRLIAHLRTNLVGWIALFVALGGTGYAAISIPRNSVGAAQLRNRSITPVKFNPESIGGSVRAWAIVTSDGRVIASSSPKPTIVTNAGLPGFYTLDWGVVLPKWCATSANINLRSPGPTETVQGPSGMESVVAGYVTQVLTATSLRPVKPRHLSATALVTVNQAGQPTPLGFDVSAIC